MNNLDAKSKIVKKILSAYDEAKEASVEDPEQKIIQTIEARKELKLFFDCYKLP